MTYSERLRDPRWQRRRLEIMQRDEFRCQSCGDETTTLNVHHRTYAAGRDPWAYDDANLVTLCEPCHALERDTRDEVVSTLKQTAASAFLFRDLVCVNNLAIALAVRRESLTSDAFAGLVATLIRELLGDESLTATLTQFRNPMATEAA